MGFGKNLGIIYFYYKSITLYLPPLGNYLKKNDYIALVFSQEASSFLVLLWYLVSPEDNNRKWQKSGKKWEGIFFPLLWTTLYVRFASVFSPGNHFPSVINTDNFTRLGKTQLVLTGHCGGLTKLCVAPRLSAPIPIPEH